MGYASILNFGSQELGLHYVEMKVSWLVASRYLRSIAHVLPYNFRFISL